MALCCIPPIMSASLLYWGIQNCTHYSCVWEGRIPFLPSFCPPDNISNAAQDTINWLLCKGMLLAHSQCAVYQELKCFSVKFLFSHVFLSMY